MVAEGADILDIGAESTRPYGGAVAVSPDEELRRLEPVLPAVVALGVPVSIDTMKAKVARAALAAGAAIVNDVWGLQRDPDMARVVAEHARAGHHHAQPRRRRSGDRHHARTSHAFFARSLEIAERAGIARDSIVLDPGIGFGKTPEQSIIAIARLGRAQVVRPAAAGRRLAQALHRHGLARAARPAPRRLDRRPSRRGRARRRHRAHP